VTNFTQYFYVGLTQKPLDLLGTPAIDDCLDLVDFFLEHEPFGMIPYDTEDQVRDDGEAWDE
jgi:hypothetical protein